MKKRILAPAWSLALAVIGASALALFGCGGSSGQTTGTGGGSGSGGSSGTGGGSGGAMTGTGGDMGSGGGQPVMDAGTGGASPTDAGDAPSEAKPDAVTNPDGGGAFNADVMMMMRKVADWYIARTWDKGWQSGAGWAGVSATYQVTKDAKYLDAIIKWAGNWALTGGAGARGDNQCAAQTMFEAYLVDPTPANMVRLTPKSSFDQLVANTPQGRVEWWWEDALFMVPPGFARLGAATSNKQYFDTMNKMYWDTYAFLWSAPNNLMYRDHRGNDGFFWARGNGWVIAGAARVLQYLPMDDPKRPDFIKVVTDMAGALKPKQGADGCWRSDLMNPNTYPQPESSGTGFFTFGIAWGVNNGILDKAMYQPVAQKGWDCLVKNVAADGRLGYVQGTGVGPNSSSAGSTPEAFGPGAFLLAGSEVAKFAP